MFKKAERRQLKARIALDGPSGSGKTYSALRAAFALGTKVAVIDTEHGAASKYAGEKPDGIEWQFDVLELATFSPDIYTRSIQEADRAGYEVLIIDSLSHAWMGKGGALDQIDQAKGANRFTAWKDVTPLHRNMIEAILACRCHVIATMRTKTEYVLEPDDKGRMVPRKIGTAPVQRDGMEYEFDVVGDLDYDHRIKINKSRCPSLQDEIAMKPDAMFWRPLTEWLRSGTPIKTIDDTQKQRINELCTTLQISPESFNKGLMSIFNAPTLDRLTTQQADQMIERLQSKAATSAV